MGFGLGRRGAVSESGVQNESFKLGLLLEVEGGGGVAEAVERIREAEQQGWDGVCLRGGPQAGAAALQAAAAAATVTERLRLGVEVSPGATLHPLRLAEDLSMIDIISAGRLEWMVAGSAGISRADQEEATQVVQKAWAGEAFSHSGLRWSFPTLRCWPSPEQQPAPPIWSAWRMASSETVADPIGRWFSLEEAAGPSGRGARIAVCGRWVNARTAGGVLRFGPSAVPYRDWANLEPRALFSRLQWLYVDPIADDSVGSSEPIRRDARASILG